MIRKWLASTIITATLAFATSASAQYTGPGGTMPGGAGTGGNTTTPTYTKRSYGVNKAAMAAVIGAGIAGGTFFLMHRHHKTVTACVSPDGKTLDDGKDVYTIIGPSLTPSERIVASGKKLKSDSGTPAFEVSAVRKDLGRCTEQTASVDQH